MSTERSTRSRPPLNLVLGLLALGVGAIAVLLVTLLAVNTLG
jgi:hypothetical protein